MKFTFQKILSVKLCVFFLVICSLCLGVKPAQADLRAPLQGAALKDNLSPDQLRRAMHFYDKKTQILQSNSADANKTIQNIEFYRNIIISINNAVSLFDGTNSVSESTYESLSRISIYYGTIKDRVAPDVARMVFRRGASETLEIIIVITGQFITTVSTDFPSLRDKPIFNTYLSALAKNDANAIAVALNNLLEDDIGQFIFSAALNFVSMIPDANLKGINPLTPNLLPVLKQAASAYQKYPVVTLVTQAVSIATDLVAAKLAANVSTVNKTSLIALEFLNYYLVTYGGDLNSFKADIGASSSTSIYAVFDHFMYQQAVLSQTMEQAYGVPEWSDWSSWSDIILGNKYDKPAAVALIRKIMAEDGMLAFTVGVDSGSGLPYVGAGDFNAQLSFVPDPLLKMDFGFLGAAVTEHRLNGNLVRHDIALTGGTFVLTDTGLGSHVFDINYGLQDNVSLAQTYYNTNLTTEVYVPPSALNFSALTITPSVSSDVNGYKVSMALALTGNAVTYNRSATATNAAATGTLSLGSNPNLRVRFVDLNNTTNVSKWVTFATGSPTVTMPLIDSSALAVKSGAIGAYRVEIALSHRNIWGVGTTTYSKVINYNDLVSNSIAPYLEVQVTSTVRAASLSASALKLTPSDSVRLSPRNTPGWPDFKALTGVISVWLSDASGKTYQVLGKLIDDGGVEFKISGAMPTTTTYQVKGIASTGGAAPDFATQQLIEIAISAGVVDLSGTGQTICWNTDGAEISCFNTGQDGELKAGVAWPIPRFTDNNNGTVTDRLTGLIFLLDADCFGSKNWSEALYVANNLSNGQCGLSDGSNIGDWRMPNITELESLINWSPVTPVFAVDHPFKNLRNVYASSTSNSDNTSLFWGIQFESGNVFNHMSKIYAYPVWPVRSSKSGESAGLVNLPRTGQTFSYALGDDGALQKGAAWPASRFTNNDDGTVVDNLTGLVWTRNADCFGYGTWGDALAAAKVLTSGACGLSDGSRAGDWRLPNFKELRSLLDFQRGYPAPLPFGHPFFNLRDVYWSSTTFPGFTPGALGVSLLNNGMLSSQGKANTNVSTWFVRSKITDPSRILTPVTTFVSENLPNGSYQVGPSTKAWRFKSGASAIVGLKAVLTSTDGGLGFNQSEIVIGEIPANSEFLVQLPINPVHDATNIKSAYWKFVDGSGQAVPISNSKTGQFWLKISTNQAPAFSPLQLVSVAGKENQQVCLPLQVADADGDSISYNITAGGGSVINGTCMGKTGPTYVNSFGAPGIIPVTILVSDGHGGYSSSTFQAVITSDSSIKDFYNDIRFANADTLGKKDQYAAIHYLTLNGITIGTPDPNDIGNNGRLFKPLDPASQAEALAMLMKSAEVRGVLVIDADSRWLPNLVVNDVANGIFQNYIWALPYVLKAEALGMIPSADTFDPVAPVKREWLATLVTRMMRLETPMDVIIPANYVFADSSDFSTTSAYNDARTTAFFGYMVGALGSTVIFNPQDEMIRADVAVVASKVLRSPTITGITTTKLTTQSIYDQQLLALNHPDSFDVKGTIGLVARRMLDDGAGTIKEEWQSAPEEYTKIYLVRPGYGYSKSDKISLMTNSPVNIPTSVPDISASEIRGLVVLLESTDVNGKNAVRGMYRMSYGVIFPDADRDGVRDSLDWWKNDPLYSIDANGNGIPDNADTLWNLSNKNGNNIVVINGKSTTLINAILDGTLLNDKTPPVTESSIQTGTYSSPQSVVLQSNETGVIYYTRDGSTPTKSSLIYTGPVYVDTTTMLRFFSVDLVGNVESAKSIVITTEIPVNGACGFSNGALLAAAPSAELCANATTPSVVGAWNWNCQGINGGETVSCSANQGYLLSVSVSGDGSGTVTSNSTSMSIIGVPNDITCTSGSCSALYPVASEVNVTSTPAIPSEATVSGACNSSPCLLTMDGSKSVTVLFKLAPHVKNNSTGLSYQTLIDALGVAQSGDEIQLLNIGFNGLVTLDKGFTLKGGWDETFTATGSTPSVLKDGLTITGGDSLVELIDIRNKLSIQGGSLRAKGVSIR